MPSLAEGFGLPVLESAACATPALASASTALAEAAGTPAATFDPTDTDAMADAISRLVVDDTHRAAILDTQRRLAAASTWDAVAQRTIEAVDRLAGDPRRVAATPITAPPRRVAVVGPSSALGAGIALFNERLVNVAARQLDTPVDLVTPGHSLAGLADGVRHVPVDAFGPDVRPASYDAVVYSLGNSHGHLATVELALRYPGWLWLHEVRLPGIAVTALEDVDDDSFNEALGWLLERSYPGRAPLHSARRAGRSVVDLVAAGVGLVALLAERCQGILVNSEVARHLLLLDLAPLTHHAPIVVLPPPCPPMTAEARPPARAVTEEDVVVAFGTVSMAKSPDLLVDAVARAGCRLAFVGPCPPFLTRYVADRARARGIADKVEVVGTVEDDEWRRWLVRATMAVQLRDVASGETSGAVLEALSAGVPVVTNLASATELPAGTVALLASTNPEVVGARLRSLLDDATERQALSQAGAAFAAAHQFSDLVRTLVSAVTV